MLYFAEGLRRGGYFFTVGIIPLKFLKYAINICPVKYPVRQNGYRLPG